VTAGDTYRDGDKIVFTEAYHLKRGYCCHNNCRHCPWREKMQITDEERKVVKDIGWTLDESFTRDAAHWSGNNTSMSVAPAKERNFEGQFKASLAHKVAHTGRETFEVRIEPTILEAMSTIVYLALDVAESEEQREAFFDMLNGLGEKKAYPKRFSTTEAEMLELCGFQIEPCHTRASHVIGLCFNRECEVTKTSFGFNHFINAGGLGDFQTCFPNDNSLADHIEDVLKHVKNQVEWPRAEAYIENQIKTLYRQTGRLRAYDELGEEYNA